MGPARLAEALPVGSMPEAELSLELQRIQQLKAAVCPGGLWAPAGGSLEVAVTDEAAGVLLATATSAELARIARCGCREHPDGGQGTAPRTDRCGCPVLGAPPTVDGHAPGVEQRRFQRQRDRGCRHPGCGQPVGRTDLDHVTAYGAGGSTDWDSSVDSEDTLDRATVASQALPCLRCA
ncbi:hypothetical protein [Blastococcus sp. SYSU DS0973]